MKLTQWQIEDEFEATGEGLGLTVGGLGGEGKGSPTVPSGVSFPIGASSLSWNGARFDGAPPMICVGSNVSCGKACLWSRLRLISLLSFPEPPHNALQAGTVSIWAYSAAQSRWLRVAELLVPRTSGGGWVLPSAGDPPPRVAAAAAGGHTGNAVHDVDWAPNMGRSYHYVAAATRDAGCGVVIWRFTVDEVLGEHPAFRSSSSSSSSSAPSASASSGGGSGGGGGGANNSAAAALFGTDTPRPTATIPARAVAPCAVLPGHATQVWRSRFNATGSTLTTSGDDGAIRMWRQSFQGEWLCVNEFSAASVQTPAPRSAPGSDGSGMLAGAASRATPTTGCVHLPSSYCMRLRMCRKKFSKTHAAPTTRPYSAKGNGHVSDTATIASMSAQIDELRAQMQAMQQQMKQQQMT